MTLRRKVLLCTGVILVAAVTVVYYQRGEIVRQAVSAYISSAFGPESSVGEIEIGLDSFRVSDLVLTSSTIPSVRISTLRGYFSFEELKQGRVEGLAIEGWEVDLASGIEGAGSPSSAPFRLPANQIDLADGTLRFAAGEHRYTARFQTAAASQAESIKFEGAEIAVDREDGLAALAVRRIEGAILQGADGTFGVELSIEPSEALLDAWYAELSPFPAQLKFSQSASGGREFSISLPQGEVNGQLEQQGEGWRGKLRSEIVDTAPLLESFAPELRERIGSLSGPLQIEGRFEGDPAAWTVTGTIRSAGLKIAQVGSLGLTGWITGKLPLSIAYPSTGKRQPDAVIGALQLRGVAVGGLAIDDGEIKLDSGVNRLGIVQPLTGKVFGGDVSVSGLELTHTGGEVSASAKAVQSAGFQLGEIIPATKAGRFEGKLNLDLTAVSWSKGILSTTGAAVADLFGGRITLGGISIENPGTPLQTIRGDAQIEGIDLTQLTGAIEFGEMFGTLDGRISGLQMFGKVPAAFDAEISTRGQGKRAISVKALNNLSVLSQGDGVSAVLSQGLYRFFDYYNFRKLGFRCRLKNDLFELSGTAREGSERYLIYGGLFPPKIDLVTENPRISFTEMLNRIARVTRPTAED